MMFKQALLASFVSVSTVQLSGCAIQWRSGVYTKLPPSHQASIANDAAAMIKSILPAASSTIVLTQPNKTTFGHRFVEELTSFGYQVGFDIKNPKGKKVSYILDEVGAKSYYLSITIDKTRFAKAYRVSEDGIEDASSWSKAEFVQ